MGWLEASDSLGERLYLMVREGVLTRSVGLSL